MASESASEKINVQSVTYSSTRGDANQKSLSFRQVVMQGLAHDRGLFVPDSLPEISIEEIEALRGKTYVGTCLNSKKLGL